ncbi:MAG: dUTP diphosphatase [Alkalispirochaetaceae bacterium]
MIRSVTIRVVGEERYLPVYQSDLAAGADLFAAIEEPVELASLERALVPTGIRVELPPGYEAQIRPRSGLAAREGVTLLNSPGTIDADYRGEIMAILVNLSDSRVTITPGMRIAQMVIAPVSQARFEQVEKLAESVRGEGGFGSTGR